MIGGERWADNPLTTVPVWIFTVIDLWLACRPVAGMLGMGAATLPCAGGRVDQPAALMDAFDLLEGLAMEDATS